MTNTYWVVAALSSMPPAMAKKHGLHCSAKVKRGLREVWRTYTTLEEATQEYLAVAMSLDKGYGIASVCLNQRENIDNRYEKMTVLRIATR